MLRSNVFGALKTIDAGGSDGKLLRADTKEGTVPNAKIDDAPEGFHDHRGELRIYGNLKNCDAEHDSIAAEGFNCSSYVTPAQLFDDIHDRDSAIAISSLEEPISFQAQEKL